MGANKTKTTSKQELFKCSRCQQYKSKSDFFKRKNRASGMVPQCKECDKKRLREYARKNPATRLQTHVNWRIKNKEKVKEYHKKYIAKCNQLILEHKNKPCADCGKTFPPYVMDFDHRDPSKKLYLISRIARIKSVSKILAEIEKCDLVCSNCHRERTFGKAKQH